MICTQKLAGKLPVLLRKLR